MFIGHYGVSFAAKRVAPRVSLGVLFLAVQAIDLVFCFDLMTGAEKMRLVPHFTAYNPYDLYQMGWSHSLFAALLWSLVVAVGWSFLARGAPERLKESLVVGAAVFSHWLLDLPMHTADLQLVPWSATRVGFGLWNHRDLALAAELVTLLVGVLIYVRSIPAASAAGRWLTWVFVAVLFALGVTTPFQPVPATTLAFAVQALFAYAVLAYVAARIDRARTRTPAAAQAPW
jgi:hypothetical protein